MTIANVRFATIFCFSALALASSGVASAQEGHAQPQRCRARVDCAEGFRCLENVCVDHATYESSRPHDTVDADSAFRFYVGAVIGPSIPTTWGNWGEGVQLAVHVGALYERVQFQLEVSPGSTLITNVSSSPLGMFEVAGTIGYLIRISDMVSWLVRIGGGGGAVFGNSFPGCCGNNPGGTAAFAAFRADVFGVAIRPSTHILMELNVPSFRLMIFPGPTDNNAMTMWVTSFAFNYLF